MADKKKIEFYVLCLICAVLGIYVAKLALDRLAAAQPKVVPKALAAVKLPAPVQKAVAVQPPLPSTLSSVVTPPVTVKKAPEKDALVLKGLIFSSVPGSSYALINNKIVKEGDRIGEAKVVRITKDNVELQDGDTAVKLSLNARSF